MGARLLLDLFCSVEINDLIGKIQTELFSRDSFDVGIVDRRMKAVVKFINSILKLIFFKRELYGFFSQLVQSHEIEYRYRYRHQKKQDYDPDHYLIFLFYVEHIFHH